MCKEDLRIGRGKRVGVITEITGAITDAPLLRANPKRTAVIISANADYAAGAVAGDVYQIKSDVKGAPVVVIRGAVNTDPVIMDVETFGELVTSQLTGDVSDVAGNNYPVLTAVEIISEINATPIITGNEK